MFPTTVAPPRAATEGSLLVAVRTDAVTQVLSAIEAEPAYAAEPHRRRGAPLVVTVIPAWNEAACIADTIDGLRHQTRPPDLIVVVANNCTDDTAGVARSCGVDVIDLPSCPGKKAGAIDHALAELLPTLAGKDRIFVQDADTVIVPEWLELANAAMDADPGTIISGRYASKPARGLLAMLQRNEFARECRMIDRRGDRTHIIVGTSTLLPVAMLREVTEARRTGRLPVGQVYVPESLTEDFELTLAAKTLGWRTASPHGCDAVTDLMPTWPMLWRQRIRWMQGGVQDLRRYGWTPITSPYHIRRAWILFGLASMLLYYATLITTLAISGTVLISVPWAVLTLVFIADRVVGVRAQGRKSMAFAALLIPEMIYNLFAQAVYATALYKAFRGKALSWHET